MIRRAVLILLVLLLVGGGGTVYYLWYYFARSGGTVKLPITREMIDSALSQTFPKKNTYLKVLHVTYGKPVLEMAPGGDRIKVALEVQVEAGLEGLLSKTYHGSAAVVTAVGYEPESYRFFLRDPRLEKLEVPKLSSDQLAILREGLNAASALWFQEVPIYRIEDRTMKEKLARHVLREVEIKNDRVIVTLGL
jgi:hypothetical protein